MQTKLKECSRCLKQKVIFKNRTVNGERLKLCQSCNNIIQRDLDKEKKAKDKVKAREQKVDGCEIRPKSK